MAEPLFNPGLPPIEAPVVEPIEPIAPVTAVDEPPVVETPAAEPVIETPVAAPTTVEVIKEVEKIVEKYPEMDEYTGEIFQALLDGKEDVLLNYLSEKHRDYATMSDYDAVKASLKKDKPNYNDQDLADKIEMQYGELSKVDLNTISEVDEPERYMAATEHNRTVDRNLKQLRLDAIEARTNLEAGKKELKLPKITQVEQPNQPSAEAIEQGRRDWEALVGEEVPKNKEFTFKVGDDETGHEDVTYAITDAEKNEDLAFFKELTFPKMLSKLNWVDENGKQNVSKMAGDVRKLEKMSQLIAAAYKQGHTAGVKSTVAEVKNLDLSTNNSSSVSSTPPDIGALGFGHLNPK